MLVRVEFTDGGVEYLEFGQGAVPPRTGLIYHIVFVEEVGATAEPGRVRGIEDRNHLPEAVAPIPAKWSFTFEIEAAGVRHNRRPPWNEPEGSGERFFR